MLHSSANKVGGGEFFVHSCTGTPLAGSYGLESIEQMSESSLGALSNSRCPSMLSHYRLQCSAVETSWFFPPSVTQFSLLPK